MSSDPAANTLYERCMTRSGAGLWLKVEPMSPNGYRAGPIRNQEMLDKGKPDLVIAFPGGKGTADMVGRALRTGVFVYRVPPGCGANVLPVWA